MPKVSEEHKEIRRQQILMAAMEVFKRKGYEKATLKDIVEEAGMSRGWIYLYFSDKNEIFRALLEHLDAEQKKQLELSNQENVLEVLKGYFVGIQNSIQVDDPTLYPAIYEFWITSWRDESVREFFLKRYEKVVATFTALFLQGIESGEISPVLSVEEIAKIMMSNMDGILVHSLAFGTDTIDVSNQVEQLLIRIEQMLKS
ncbi:TetR/AcrR family transcriptional regulator [Fredinandcohnia sp. 179-A 10B2 NHS]|uniref:TetR/AcrR family transcriptional regulator n=1 Tax=Fredinandcohnia sp. 179-A 10B2 NHS TaxID=3235176 RepID=UPI0039A3A2D3